MEMNRDQPPVHFQSTHLRPAEKINTPLLLLPRRPPKLRPGTMTSAVKRGASLRAQTTVWQMISTAFLLSAELPWNHSVSFLLLLAVTVVVIWKEHQVPSKTQFRALFLSLTKKI